MVWCTAGEREKPSWKEQFNFSENWGSAHLGSRRYRWASRCRVIDVFLKVKIRALPPFCRVIRKHRVERNWPRRLWGPLGIKFCTVGMHISGPRLVWGGYFILCKPFRKECNASRQQQTNGTERIGPLAGVKNGTNKSRAGPTGSSGRRKEHTVRSFYLECHNDKSPIVSYMG